MYREGFPSAVKHLCLEEKTALSTLKQFGREEKLNVECSHGDQISSRRELTCSFHVYNNMDGFLFAYVIQADVE